MRELPEGDALFSAVRNRVCPQARLAFVSAFVTGLAAHLYMLLNKLPNHDDILGMFLNNESTYTGRWFLFVPSAFSSNISMPWVNGLLALLWLSLAVSLATRVLALKKPVLIVLCAAVMAVFPTVCYTFCYMFTADAYLFGLLLASLGAYCTDRFRWGFLPGAVCVALSLGVYQAYVFFAIGLLAVRLLAWILSDDAFTPKVLWSKLWRMLAVFLLGALLYLAGQRISQAVRGVALKTYMGISSLGSASPLDYITRIPLAYRSYFDLGFGKTELLPGRLQALSFLFVTAASVVFACVAALRMQGKHRALRTVLALALLCTLPLLFNGIVLLSSEGLHPLMQYPICLSFACAAVLYGVLAERCQSGLQKRLRVACGYALALCLAAVSLKWALAANQTYLALELKFDNMLSLATRMVDRVEQLPDYVPDETPVWYTGTLSDAHYGAVKNDTFARASATDMTGRAWNYTFFMNNLYFRAFVNTYVGVSFVEPDEYRMAAILESDAYKAMPYFPEAGSVQCVDGVVIINGGPNPQSPP